ncbi:hypothetical protein KDA14_02845 [Candidatus Saccharibacteria bacterium]|nr:hypothetical protein [Candidatus Saccharibacteria bacterium]
MVQELDLVHLDSQLGVPTLTIVGAFNRAARKLEASHQAGVFVGRALVAYVSDTPEQLASTANIFAEAAPDRPGSERTLVENNARIAAVGHVEATVGSTDGRGIVAALIEIPTIPNISEQVQIRPFELQY